MRRIVGALGLIAALYANPANAKDQRLDAEPLSVKHDCYANAYGYTTCGINVAAKVSGKSNPVSIHVDTEGSLKYTLELANFIQLEIDDKDHETIPFMGKYTNLESFKATYVKVKNREYNFNIK